MFLIEKAFAGGRRYWLWLGALALLILAALLGWIQEQQVGLAITDLSRNMPWGLYIGQFIFCVGVGDAALVVMLPYYLHHWTSYAKVALLGQILGTVGVFMAMLFILVSMGKPVRLINVLLYPHPRSLIFWDMLTLSGYVILTAIIIVRLLIAEQERTAPPLWAQRLVLLSFPWAVGIHTVTAFLLCGLVARPYWFTALLAPRFLASALTAGSAMLVLILLLLKRLKLFDAGEEPLRRLATTAAYCLVAHVFFTLVEFFNVFYAGVPQEAEHVNYLYGGINKASPVAPWMWLSAALALVALLVLLVPALRVRSPLLIGACASVVISIWIEKGFGMLVGGFEPSPFGATPPYVPAFSEWRIAAGIWALGAFLITLMYKIVFSVRQEAER